MKTVASSDTHPEAARQQVELMRQATVARRFGAARSLSTTVAELSRRALRRRMPGATDTEIGLAFVALHYGDELARRVRAHLDTTR
ncbi:MAG: hypothetical protein ACE5HV_01320 [Acidobacteriota bacterium]